MAESRTSVSQIQRNTHGHHNEGEDVNGRQWHLHEDWVQYRENRMQKRAQEELEADSKRISEDEEQQFRQRTANDYNQANDIAEIQNQVDNSNDLSKKINKSDGERMRLLGHAHVENENFNAKFTNQVNEQHELRQGIADCEHVVRLWNKEMGNCNSIRERAEYLSASEQKNLKKKVAGAKDIVKIIKADFVNQASLLMDQVKTMGETQKAQHDVEQQVKSTCDDLNDKMRSALEKAAIEREKCCKELNQLRMEALTVGMSCQDHEARTDIQNSELKRMTHAVAAAEKSFNDLFDLYKMQFQDLSDVIEANTVKMDDLRVKQNDCQSKLYKLKTKVHDGALTIESMRVERNMRVNLDDQYETNRLMIMIEDNIRRTRSSTELAERTVAEWQARVNDLQRNIDLMQTQTQETLLNGLTAKYISEIEDKNKEIVDLLKQKAELSTQLRHCSSPEEVSKLQEQLRVLIDQYQDKVKERCQKIAQLMEKIREYMQLQEDILATEEDIERVKSLIYLGEQDNCYLKTVVSGLNLQIYEIREKTGEILREKENYYRVFREMDYAFQRECDEIEWLEKMITLREEELSWWQYEWEDHTHPEEPEMIWELKKTAHKTKNMNHVALQGDPIDEDAACIFNDVPLFVSITRLDMGEYLFGRLHIFCEYGDYDGDGKSEELMACIVGDGDEEAPPMRVWNYATEADAKKVGGERKMVNSDKWKLLCEIVTNRFKQEHLHHVSMGQGKGGVAVPTGHGKQNATRQSVMINSHGKNHDKDHRHGSPTQSFGGPGGKDHQRSPRASMVNFLGHSQTDGNRKEKLQGDIRKQLAKGSTLGSINEK